MDLRSYPRNTKDPRILRAWWDAKLAIHDAEVRLIRKGYLFDQPQTVNQHAENILEKSGHSSEKIAELKSYVVDRLLDFFCVLQFGKGMVFKNLLYQEDEGLLKLLSYFKGSFFTHPRFQDRYGEAIRLGDPKFIRDSARALENKEAGKGRVHSSKCKDHGFDIKFFLYLNWELDIGSGLRKGLKTLPLDQVLDYISTMIDCWYDDEKKQQQKNDIWSEDRLRHELSTLGLSHK